MKAIRLIMLFLVGAFMSSGAVGQANASLNVLTLNGGVVNQGGTVDIQVTVGATTGTGGQPGPIPTFRVRAQISVPFALVTLLPNASQTGLPPGWIIVSNNPATGVITVCNGNDPIPVGQQRQILIKVQGANLGGPSTVSGNLFFGSGATCTAPGTLAGDDPSDNTSQSSIRVISGTGCNLSASATAGAIACNGGTTTLTVTATGATGTVEYSLNGGAFQASNIFTVGAGTHIVTVREVSTPTCTATTAAVTVTQPAAITASATAGTILCNGGTTTLTVTATGGTSPLQYSLNGGTFQSGNSFTVGAGSYSVTVRDANLCTATTATITVTQPTALTATATSNPVTTTGGSDGTATAIPSGGTSPYTYSWNTTPVQTTITATGLTTGSYTVTVTDANGCTTTATTTVGSPSCNLSASATAGTIACNGGTTTLTVTATGGTGALEYSLNGGTFQSGNTFTVGAGTHTVTVRETTNPTCSITTAAVTITQPTALTATATSTPVTTTGGSDGTATAIPSGGTSPYTYSWNSTPVQTTITATGLMAGSYTVTVTDANGCTTAANTTVGSPACSLSASATAGTIACNGGTTILTVTASGGTGTLEYSLNSGTFQSGNTFTVGAGTHSVTVRETANPTCTATTAIVTVTQPIPLTASASAGTIACNSGTTTLTVTASGGTGALEYSLNGGAFLSGNTFTVGAGTHTVTVRDANLCTATTAAVTIIQPPPLTSTATSTPVTTSGGSDGTATAAPSGGTAPYTYSWNTTPIQTSVTATGLTAGSYTVTVTDANGCTITATTTVGSPSCNLLASASAEPIACNGGTTTLTASATGATGSVEYSLNGGAFQASNTFTVGAGTHIVTVRETANPTCTATASALSVTQPTAITASAIAGTIVCNGGTTTLTVTATGGTGAFQFSLNGGSFQSGNTFIVGAGTHTVTLRDANLCTATTAAVTVTEPTVVTASASAGTITCNGGTTTLTVTATGGTGAFQYSWNGGTFQSGNTFTVGAGTHAVTVRDANLCTATTAAVTITQPAALTVTATSTPVTTTGGSDGTATAIPAGGTSPYTYSWNTTPVQTTITATGLTAGSYTVTVTDANGCTTTATTTVGSPACNLTASATAGTIACNGGTTTLIVTATGGTGALQYSLNGGPFQPGNIFTVAAGAYTVNVKDAFNCTATTAALTVTQPAAITASASSGTIACNGGTTTLTVTATGGAVPLQFSLNGGAFQSGNAFIVGAGTHTVTVRDANLCTAATNAVTVTEPTAITVSATAGAIACNGGTTTLTVTATGGIGSLHYSLNGGAYQSGNSFTAGAGSHTVTVRDANLCTATAATVTVTEPTALTGTATSTPVTTVGGTDGTATATAAGGISPYTYSWNTIPVQTTVTATGLTAGSYTVTITDANGCTTTATITVGSPVCNLVASTAIGAIACNGGTITLTVSATGGTGVLQYSLNGGAFQPGNTFTVGAGTYTVRVRDAINCTVATAPVTVTQPATLTASVTARRIAECGGTTEVVVTASGGTAPYSGSVGTVTRGPGTWTFTVTDAVGCTSTSQIIIEAPGCMELKVSPNPASSSIKVDHSIAQQGSTMQVFSINGSLVLSKPVPENAFHTTIDVSRLAQGSYILAYLNGNEKNEILFVKTANR